MRISRSSPERLPSREGSRLGSGARGSYCGREAVPRDAAVAEAPVGDRHGGAARYFHDDRGFESDEPMSSAVPRGPIARIGDHERALMSTARAHRAQRARTGVLEQTLAYVCPAGVQDGQADLLGD